MCRYQGMCSVTTTTLQTPAFRRSTSAKSTGGLCTVACTTSCHHDSADPPHLQTVAVCPQLPNLHLLAASLALRVGQCCLRHDTRQAHTSYPPMCNVPARWEEQRTARTERGAAWLDAWALLVSEGGACMSRS
jgi:hypothetical protein